MNQLIPDLPFAKYLNMRTPAGDVVFSNTHMKLALDAPRRLKHALENPEDPKKECFVVGRGLHGNVLENRQTYLIHPDQMPDSKGNMKDWSLRLTSAKQWVEDQNGADVVSQETHEEILAWTEAIRNTPRAWELLRVPGRSEVTVVALDPEFSLPTKIRIDWLPNEGTALIDIKTCKNASPEEFEKAVQNLGYDLQAWNYLYTYNLIAEQNGWPLKTDFAFIAVEKEPPYIVKVYHLNGLYLHTGRKKRELAMTRIKQSVETGNWDAYETDRITTLTPNDWYCKKWGLGTITL